MKTQNKILGFDWNSEEEWESYIESLENLYSSIDRYMKNIAYLKSLNGTDITYASTKTNAFFNIRTVNEWKRFMRDIYGIETLEVREEEEDRLQESTRVYWISNFTEKGEEVPDITCQNSFYCIISHVYELLSSAGFKSNAQVEDFPNHEELLATAEDLIREIIKHSPIFNPKSFFLLSLRFIPYNYAISKYGNLERIEEMMKWRKVSSWSNISDEWQIYSFKDSFWSKIADSLHILYGFSPVDYFWNSSLDFWNIVARYIGENLHAKYLRNATNSVLRAYAGDKILSEYVEGTLEPEDILFAEAEIKSIKNLDVVYFTVVDEISSKEIPFECDNLIKFIAPQMFLNIGTMYISDAIRWTLGFYIPAPLLSKEIKKDTKIEAVDVNPIVLDRKSVLPSNWEMHLLRNILRNIDFHLEYLVSMTEEYEDLEGDEE